jgi:hypothetical protein
MNTSTISNKDTINNFFLYFAGHGVSVYDNSGDETDGLDEAIVCYNGMLLVDDWFYENLVLKLNANTRCLLINDCCRSGSIYDLPVSYSFDRNAMAMKLIPSTKRVLSKDSSIKTKCVGISGCADSQYSMEFNESKNTVRGIFTAGLIQAWTKKNILVTEESCVSIGNRIQAEMDSLWKLKFGYPMEYFKQFVNVSTSKEMDDLHKSLSTTTTTSVSTALKTPTPTKTNPIAIQTLDPKKAQGQAQTNVNKNKKREMLVENEEEKQTRILQPIVQAQSAVKKLKTKTSSRDHNKNKNNNLFTWMLVAGIAAFALQTLRKK